VRALAELESEAAIFEMSDSRETIQFVEQHPNVDLILLHFNFSDRDGFSVLTERGKHRPAISVVAISAYQDRDNVSRALDLRVLGFIPKSAPWKVILAALRPVVPDGIHIPPQALSPGTPPALWSNRVP
jgi:DNA-binding NarL/FixJ family response regulator